MWGTRMGKYKKNKQEGKWLADSYWYSDERFNDTPYIRREEYFKKGLQHGRRRNLSHNKSEKKLVIIDNGKYAGDY